MSRVKSLQTQSLLRRKGTFTPTVWSTTGSYRQPNDWSPFQLIFAHLAPIPLEMYSQQFLLFLIRLSHPLQTSSSVLGVFIPLKGLQIPSTTWLYPQIFDAQSLITSQGPPELGEHARLVALLDPSKLYTMLLCLCHFIGNTNFVENDILLCRWRSIFSIYPYQHHSADWWTLDMGI